MKSANKMQREIELEVRASVTRNNYMPLAIRVGMPDKGNKRAKKK